MTTPRGTRQLYALALAGVLALGAAHGVRAEDADHPKDKPFAFAVDMGFAPFAFKTPAGEVTGFSIEFAKEIARRLGRPGIEAIDVNYSAIFAGLFAKRYEAIMAPTNITAERSKQMLFTQGYMATGLGFLTSAKAEGVKGVEEMKGKVLAVNNGSISDTWATENAAKYGWTVERFDKNADAVEAVLTERAWANVADLPVSQYVATQNKALKVDYIFYTGRSFGLAFRPDDKAFRREVEDAVKCMKLDGTLAAINEKWFKAPPGAETAMRQLWFGYGPPGFEGYEAAAATLLCR
ncbi:MAG: substrate-binding periplasmic protein [Alphaproteobacteria bacterium]